MISKTDLGLTKDGAVVHQHDVECRTVLVGKGCWIEDVEAARLGILGGEHDGGTIPESTIVQIQAGQEADSTVVLSVDSPFLRSNPDYPTEEDELGMDVLDESLVPPARGFQWNTLEKMEEARLKQEKDRKQAEEAGIPYLPEEPNPENYQDDVTENSLEDEEEEPDESQCIFIRANGERCKLFHLPDSTYCRWHKEAVAKREAAEQTEDGSSQGEAGE